MLAREFRRGNPADTRRVRSAANVRVQAGKNDQPRRAAGRLRQEAFQSFDRSVDVLIGKLRRKIEADPKHPCLIVTVPGEGYRFDGLRFTPPEIGKPDAESVSKREGEHPPRLSIVVLPFANIGGGPEQEHFVDGVTESLTTDLSRIRNAVVIGRNTAFTYKGKIVDSKQMGRELNVRYILEGSVQRGGARMRVNVQLIDAETSNHLWAERFDKPLADIFDMQDEIVARLAGALNTELVAAEARRAERSPTPNSMDFHFQAMAWLNKGPTPSNVAQARSFFNRALSADPCNVEALVGSGFVNLIEAALSFVADPVAAFAAAEAKLTIALASVPDHALGHTWLGFVDILTKRAPQGIAECEHGLALDRNLASAHALIGQGKIFIGRAEETEAHVVEPQRLSPGDTWAYAWLNMVGLRSFTSAVTSRQSLGFDDRRRPTEIMGQRISIWRPPWRSLVDLMRRIRQ